MCTKVSFEMRAFSVRLAAARVFTAVDGRPLLTRGPSTALPLDATRGQLWADEQGLLVKGQMSGDLTVGVVTVKVAIVVEVRHVAVVSGVRGHSLWWHEPAVVEANHRGRGVERVKVT